MFCLIARTWAMIDTFLIQHEVEQWKRKILPGNPAVATHTVIGSVKYICTQIWLRTLTIQFVIVRHEVKVCWRWETWYYCSCSSMFPFIYQSTLFQIGCINSYRIKYLRILLFVDGNIAMFQSGIFMFSVCIIQYVYMRIIVTNCCWQKKNKNSMVFSRAT